MLSGIYLDATSDANIRTMYTSTAKPGWREIDGQRVYTDSLAEATFIKRLVKDGFSGKWRRTRTGIESGHSRYTPDVELSIDVDGKSYRALVEYKSQSATEFTMRDRRRFSGITKHYPNALPYLYVCKTKQWYLINPNGKLTRTNQPIPGMILIDALPKPAYTIPVFNRYARIYQIRPLNYWAKIFANMLEFGVQAIFAKKMSRRRRRR